MQSVDVYRLLRLLSTTICLHLLPCTNYIYKCGGGDAALYQMQCLLYPRWRATTASVGGVMMLQRSQFAFRWRR